jgi:hypothetical protein
MFTEKQKLGLEISDYKYRLRKVLKEGANPNLKDSLASRIEYLESKLTRLKEIELKLENEALEAKRTELFNARCADLKAKRNRPKTRNNIYPGVYYEVWIDGSLYLECTSCSADGPGNCSCWLID